MLNDFFSSISSSLNNDFKHWLITHFCLRSLNWFNSTFSVEVSFFFFAFNAFFFFIFFFELHNRLFSVFDRILTMLIFNYYNYSFSIKRFKLFFSMWSCSEFYYRNLKKFEESRSTLLMWIYINIKCCWKFFSFFSFVTSLINLYIMFILKHFFVF